MDPRQEGPESELNRVLVKYPVDVVMWEHCRPPKDHVVWRSESGVTKMLWTKPTAGSWKVPRGWKLSKRRLYHQNVGGVTNCAVTFYQVQRVSDSKDSWAHARSHVMQTLHQIVDPTQGGRLVDVPMGEEPNTARGILDWNNRSGKVIVPTVYSKDKWGRRKLSPEELSAALDLPGHVRKRLSHNQLRHFNTTILPGKLLTEAIYLSFPSSLVDDTPPHATDTNVPGSGTKREDEGVRPVKRQRMDTWTTKSESVPTPEVPRNPPEMTTVTAKAVKSDDAGIPDQLWDLRLVKGLGWSPDQAWTLRVKHALNTLRKFLLRAWKRKVKAEFDAWFQAYKKEIEAGTKPRFSLSCEDIRKRGEEAVRHAWRATWWEWDGGSSILFWRWPKEYQLIALEGLPPMFVSAPPQMFEPQPPYSEEEIRRKVLKKVSKVIEKGYIVILPKGVPSDVVEALMYMFDVEKGKDDIRMVYDGSKNGLNAALWAPWFCLPTVDTLCRTLLPTGWCGDNDYGEQFLNFPLHREVQPYCGVDLTQLFPEYQENLRGLVVGIWKRNAMGLKPSPYACVQGALRAKRIMLGNPKDERNPFHWATIELNLPGSPGYNCKLPWLILRRRDGSIATSLHQYIDDLRITGATPELVWEASMRIGKICAWLGLQDAARKRREPSQNPGAWAGSVVITDNTHTYKTVTQERWNKARAKIRWLGAHLGLEDEWTKIDEDGAIRNPETPWPKEGSQMFHKRAESYRGFLVYVARTFAAMTPFLKGLHLTLDGWRPNRDEDGWRIHSEKGPMGVDSFACDAPQFVRPVPRLKNDVATLMSFTNQANPPKVPARPTKVGVGYLVGDASGSGFGSTLWCEGQTHVGAEFGAWSQETSNKSSNYREALNLVLRLEALVESGNIAQGTELFVFTDNSTAERAFYNGSSRSKHLHELVVRLRLLEMRGKLFVHVIWIAGSRMIEQGTDGLSRGDFSSGVLNGHNFLDFVPLAKTVIERQPTFKIWLLDALPGDWTVLQPEDWFHSAFGDPTGKYIWWPSPALANVALEQLCEVKHVHPDSSHVFVTPTLFTALWRRQLRKAADLMTTVPCGSTVWPTEEHEPLTLAFVCPLLSQRPWRFKFSPEVERFQVSLSGMWCTDSSIGGSCVRKLWEQAWRLQGGM